jgi:copper transport protein
VEVRSTGRRRRRFGLVLVLLAALAVAPEASAHAVLLTTEPSNDAVVARSPARVVLRFNETVETAFGGIRVFDASARRVDSGRVARPDSAALAVDLDGELADGTYTVAWRVVSADSHPISGAFVFHVREPGAEPAGIASEVLESGSGGVRTLATAVRFVDFGLLLASAGGAAALVLVLGDGGRPLRRRLASALAVASLGLAAAAAAGIVLQGATAGGFGVIEALDPDVVEAVLDTRFGRIWLLQAAAAVALSAVALALRRRESELASGLAVGLAVVLVVTPALAGHASVSGGVAMLADAGHVAAAAAWAGGLTFLVAALMWAGSGRWALAAEAVPRFSTLAVGAVVLLLVTGTINGYLQVKALRGLWETTYGLLLLGKVALVLPLLALGAYNNRFAVPRLRAQVASGREQRRFLRTVGVELGLMVAVVALTAALVAEPPAKAEVTPAGPFATTAEVGPNELNLVVDPAQPGSNEIHLYLTDQTGQPATVAEARVSATLPSRRVGPLRFRALRAGPGHYLVDNANLALAGDWRIRLDLRVGEFESQAAVVSVPIREE